MPIIPPKIDTRDQKMLVKQLREQVLNYCPEYRKDASLLESDKYADALINIFSRMMGIIIQRLNKVPDKNFLTFLDLNGVSLYPPRVARAPLSFTMAEGASEYGSIPAGTQVATADEEPVVFETENELTVIQPKLVKAVSINPWIDRWTDHVLNAEEEEVLFKGKNLIPHRLYLGHKELFSLKEKATITLDVNLSKGIALKDWEVKWYFYDKDSQPKPLTPVGSKDVINLLKSGKIIFKDISGISEKTLTGYEKDTGKKKSWANNWIFAELQKPIPEELPEIDTIKAMVTIVTIESKSTLDLAFFNNLPIDLTKDFYPFGEKPKFNDTFYLGSEEVFSKEKASITIKVQLSDKAAVPLPDTTKIKLRWEYWNGKSWEKIWDTTQNGVPDLENPCAFKDTTNAFTKEGEQTVVFKCPDIEPIEINGQKSYWIRVRIAEGDYGKEATYEQKKDRVGNLINEWEYKPPTFKPPSISAIKMGYSFTSSSDFQAVLSYNDFAYYDQTQIARKGGKFSPFQAVEDKQPALYLAFDKNIATLPVTIFFPLLEKIFTYQESEKEPKENASLIWEYWTGNNWHELKVEDNTKNLTERDIIQFLAPADITDKPCFEEEHYWLRARLERGKYEDFPSLKAMHTNTVWAHNMVTVQNEILGSGNGKPGQVFKFSLSPVLQQKVFVREVSLTEEEKRAIIREEGNDAIVEILDSAGNVIGFWVRWHEMEHFYFSKPDSRHYAIDRTSGTIAFGDGGRGMIPPAGKDNIRCSYRSGGGARGNVGDKTITKLRKSFPYIDSVTNFEAADGGGDQENLERVKERGPQTLKHRERAVAYEDFEWLVREASPKVAKVKCLPTTHPSLQFKPGWITLIIVPESDDPKPLPTQQLIREIENYLFARTSTHLTSQINLIGAKYIRIGVEAYVSFTSIAEAKTIEGRIMDNLKQFFHPLKGGVEKRGWDFGRNVYISEVYEVIEKTEGVDYVDELFLNASIQVYKLILKNRLTIPRSYPENSRIETSDGKISFSLAEKLQEEEINSLNVVGFKEGDIIILSHKGKSTNLVIKSLSHERLGDILECEPSEIDDAYPVRSIVKTIDERIKSFILNEVPAGDISLNPLKISILKAGESFELSLKDDPSTRLTGNIKEVNDRVEKIPIDTNYLVYSGEHSVNTKIKEGFVFPYLMNTKTKEIHDLNNEQTNCKLNEIKNDNMIFVRVLDKIDKYDYCRWCFGPEMSKR